MKVLIVNNMAPFIWGGAEELAVNLQRNLIIAGHDAEVMRIPAQWEPASRIPSQMLMTRTMEIFNTDHVIALKFPAYLVRHHRKSLWLLHQYRQAYDLYDVGQTNLPADQSGTDIRNAIINADNETFAESRHIYTNSEVTRQRLFKYNGFDSQVLLPPVNDPEALTGGEYGDYIFAGGRVNSMKRQYLLLQALAKADQRVKLVIAGPPESHADTLQLHSIINEFGLHDRVKLDLGFLPRATYVNYVNQALAVAYIPFDEDSLGYVAMEAATARKALITTTDSGGILGLVTPHESGWRAEPTAESLAEAMNAAFESKTRTIQYGEGAQALWNTLGINWPETIEALLK
ncbi:glycosyltransferase family 4 protein [Pseudomonas monsensis]|jgi:glycosyltransferase involved in cell wall biosynthesis|uniref:Glycosyltransferase family 4 protein n=1 Tax=Pseudomonas monsensis TaxID=2745509 RepID=A0ABT3YW11_9PSED|nr:MULTISPECIES: glycosyltransferase family 4 protein [Pseudomonas]MCY0109699.1 glycosyltransferase family 4 protein [Pseudomonas monsensis]RON62627.1 glycosyl transferase family 1 [Pseudomonas fluorescens]